MPFGLCCLPHINFQTNVLNLNIICVLPPQSTSTAKGFLPPSPSFTEVPCSVSSEDLETFFSQFPIYSVTAPFLLHPSILITHTTSSIVYGSPCQLQFHPHPPLLPHDQNQVSLTPFAFNISMLAFSNQSTFVQITANSVVDYCFKSIPCP